MRKASPNTRIGSQLISERCIISHSRPGDLARRNAVKTDQIDHFKFPIASPTLQPTNSPTHTRIVKPFDIPMPLCIVRHNEKQHKGVCMKLLKELCETPGIPGREQPIIDIMQRELSATCQRVRVDGLGNVIGYRGCGKPDARKVMLAGHMDEIGFIVSHVDSNGFIRFAPRGGHIPRVLISQRVRIVGAKKTLIGVVEGAPAFLAAPDQRSTVPALKDLYIDTGLPEKTVKKQISVGDMIVLDRGFHRQGDICISKAFDNRVACWVIARAMEALKEIELNVDVYAVGTTQEEVGLRGAYTAAFGINPDLGIAVDVTGAFDTPGVAEHQQVTALGKGTAIKINDAATISNHGVVEHFKALATEHKIACQTEILPFGGTDAGAMQRFGAGPVCTLSVPTRYVHSPNEMINRKDLQATVDLLVAFIKTAQDCTLAF
jgi:endoglucanase